jgi:hypothetical protein
VVKGLSGKIDVQGRPVKMVRTRAEDMRELGNRRVAKPREVLEWHEPLAALHYGLTD